jgi:hypothetical protein
MDAKESSRGTSGARRKIIAEPTNRKIPHRPECAKSLQTLKSTMYHLLSSLDESTVTGDPFGNNPMRARHYYREEVYNAIGFIELLIYYKGLFYRKTWAHFLLLERESQKEICGPDNGDIIKKV